MGQLGCPAKAFLQSQPESFDFASIVERYVNAASVFAAWLWSEINTRSLNLVDELNRKAMELHLWQQAEVGLLIGLPMEIQGHRPIGTAGHGEHVKRKMRYDYGSPGFRLWAVDTAGIATLIRDDGWTFLPRYY
ncbi:hypothetical protein [Mycobacterium sp. shizuoka-1]|uniref:hypothetical protein n=1 Tax=Mycobacterium sp. shizuoka-1 TaxID=2039281 RepID=UPI000C067E36|nr:hypothetical protein [Mycobacterium sp. shizuoka-1]GAY13447.1 hypothetical protein MSZK_01730 [Mycobacterium sp. shizuoka-1]